MIGGVCAVRAAGVALLAVLGVAFGAFASLAQAGYPNRPINILTPTTAGSGMEVQLRLISDVIQRKSGHPFVIEPKPGAMGMLAATNRARETRWLFAADHAQFAPRLQPTHAQDDGL